MKRLLAFSLLVASATAFAGTPIDQTRNVNADVTVKIGNVKGAVHVTAWDRDQVHVTGTLGQGAKPLEIEQEGNTLSIQVKAPDHKGWFNWHGDSNMEPTTLNVQVPRGASLAVDTVSASTDISGMSGGTIESNSVSGDVRIDADSPKVDVNAVSGRVQLSGTMGKTNVQTVSGDIVAPQVREGGDLETVSGQIRLSGGPYASVTMNTVSGDIEVKGGLAGNGRIEIDSVSGDVSMDLPASLSAQMRVSTFSGSIHSAFGTVVEKRHGPGSSLDSTVGGGNGRIEVQTFSGDVRLQRKD
jgi:DUF4097 and DUF4098 domain-containing protein YvlB